MNTSSISSKEILAKLMATENILVEHSNVPTAYFDLINRKLVLPIWKDISDDVYTLLISHEVGHALYTPTEDWTSAVKAETNGQLKTIINIIEDVRIEKLIQAKFPGTVKSFKSGYSELEKSNLFGTQGKDVSSYGLLDRINIHFKVGHFGYAKVPFSADESIWLKKISLCNTFSDVVRVAKELKEFVENTSQEENNSTSGDSKSSSNIDDSSMKSKDTSGKQESFDESSGSQSDGSEENSSKEFTESDGSFDGSITTETNTQSDSKSLSTESPTNKDLTSETQESFDSAIKKFVDSQAGETVYANLPKLDLDNFIVSYSKVHEEISSYYSKYYPSLYEGSDTDPETYKLSNKGVVNQLANIFEMKKKAKLDVRALTSRTGKLDTNKIYSYRYNEDIFKKHTVVPEGKSHGLVMFLDMSGSMFQNMYGTYEQLLNLVLFCRRVNIPFDVYGFTNNYYSRSKYLKEVKFKVGELSFYPEFCLRHYFSNKMTGAEFNQAIKNILCLMNSYKNIYGRGLSSVGVPNGESLNETPIVPTLITATEIVNQFRKKYSLDIVNVILLSDGDDTHGTQVINSEGGYKDITKQVSRYRYAHNAKNRYFIRDPKTFKQWEITDSTKTCLDILKNVSGVKVIGFHIVQKREIEYKLRNLELNAKDIDSKLSCFKENKYCEVNNVGGYDAYYFIPSDKNLRIESSEFEPTIDTTVDWDDQKQAKRTIKAVTKNFNTFMKQKVTNRILLNRFIEHIA